MANLYNEFNEFRASSTIERLRPYAKEPEVCFAKLLQEVDESNVTAYPLMGKLMCTMLV